MNDGIYLHTRYVDPRRGEVREREYADDGTVWVTVDGERSVRCRLDAAAVEAGGRAVVGADLDALDDIDADGPDRATMSYEWRVGERRGRLVDAAYPAVVPEMVDRLEATLLRLEEAAGDQGG